MSGSEKKKEIDEESTMLVPRAPLRLRDTVGHADRHKTLTLGAALLCV